MNPKLPKNMKELREHDAEIYEKGLKAGYGKRTEFERRIKRLERLVNK